MRLLLVVALAAGSLITAGALLLRRSQPPAASELRLYVAASLKPAISEAATAFLAEQGVRLLPEYGASGDMLGKLAIAGAAAGDLFLPADLSFLDTARSRGLVKEVIPLATQKPVLVVAAGNPQGVRDLDDLLGRDGLRFGLANPESASLGRLLKRELEKTGRWELARSRATTMKPTLPDLTSDLAVGALDGAVLWDAVAKRNPRLQIISEPFPGITETVAAGVLTAARDPAGALRLARWLASPERGNPLLAQHGYTPIAGDRWTPRPAVALFSGSVNKRAISESIAEFQRREGVEITTTFNGCGILCGQMQLGRDQGAPLPDAYYACDICFVAPVAEHFPEALMLTEMPIVIAVRQGNPRNVQSLADLALDGLKVGVCNAEQSTLGYMTMKMLDRYRIRKAVMANVVSQVPTGDLLVGQLIAGALDAAVVYRTNAAARSDLHLVTLPKDAKAVQPFAINKDTPHRQLMERLLAHLQGDPRRFIEAGFTRIDDQRMIPSADLPVPEWLRQQPATPAGTPAPNATPAPAP